MAGGSRPIAATCGCRATRRSRARSSWSFGGAWLATSGADAAIVWPFGSKEGPIGKAPRECGIRHARVTRVAFHPHVNVLAIGYEDGCVLLVRFDDGAELLVRRPDEDSAVTALAWDKAAAGSPSAARTGGRHPDHRLNLRGLAAQTRNRAGGRGLSSVRVGGGLRRPGPVPRGSHDRTHPRPRDRRLRGPRGVAGAGIRAAIPAADRRRDRRVAPRRGALRRQRAGIRPHARGGDRAARDQPDRVAQRQGPAMAESSTG